MTIVFVYGTLMKGHSNHRLLTGSRYCGKARLSGFGLYCVTPFFPGIIPKEGAAVWGEVYEVDTDTLKRLDRLEVEGSLYSRGEVTCIMEDGSRESVILYLWLGAVNEEDYVPAEFTPWYPQVLRSERKHN